ncbi:MAG: bacteriocin family protein [Gammaproteobacteria bacterium]|nr:bacteriocin family protein [Gammaproteobacteria bacterium]TVQ44339.1 MAG: bacteriocin [Gammaproteobacteria bacterium]
MNDLYRELAPITAEAWSEIEAEASAALKATLAGRRVVDFRGPLGWQASSIDLGRTTQIESPVDGATARLRRVQPLLEIRIPFEVDRREIDALARGARNPELEHVIAAARQAAMVEDSAIFSGFEPAGIAGIGSASAHAPISLSADYTSYPEAAAEAIRLMRDEGVDGPYAIALGPRCYAGLSRTTHVGGYPVLEHLRQLVDGPLVYAPAVNGSVALSMRGGDFELTVGRDFSIGYLEHDARSVQLYIESSFTFLNNAPEAAVALVYTAS